MGCNSSKLDDEEAVQLCKDRKKFIKQAVEYRLRFASGHIAYIQSLKRVSVALRDYIEGDEPREFSLDSYMTPVKTSNPKFITISPKCFSSPPTIQSEVSTSMKISYYRPEGNPPVSVEERPPMSPETVRVQSYNTPMYNSYYGIDGFFTMQSPSSNPSYYYSPNDNRPTSTIPPPSPQTSQWDFFWNPFSSLDYYGYPMRSSLDPSVIDDDISGLRRVREAEGIPDLEEETEQEDANPRRAAHVKEERDKKAPNRIPREEEVTVEDVDEGDEDEDDNDNDCDDETKSGECECKCEHGEEVNGFQTQGHGIPPHGHGIPPHGHGIQPHGSRSTTELSKPPGSQRVEVHHHETAVGERETKEEAPGFTVYVNKRPTSMDEVIKDLETQFTVVCNSAKEVSSLLESRSAQYLSMSNEITPMKMLNPVALFRSGSSRSSSSRFLVNSSPGSREESYDDSSSDFSAESCLFSGGHQSTLDRLYAWEKRLYGEVRAGERIRLAYEKKCKQLRNQDSKGGADPSSLDKTRATIRDLHTQIKVAIHSIEAISRRIETLRDEELHPQILELVQGLSRMWKVMAECHQTQKRTLDDAKLLLAGTPSKLQRSRRNSSISLASTTCSPDPSRLCRAASNLEAELRNWKSCFETWITSQRSYVHALTGWLLRCMRCEPDTSKLPFSPRHPSSSPSSMGVPPPIFGICIQWSRLVDSVREVPVLDGLDFFAAGMGSIYAQQMREDSRKGQVGGSRRFYGNMDVIEYGKEEEDAGMTQEKMAEVAVRVLCAGMSVAVSSLTEFAVGSAQGYVELVNQWENVKWPPPQPPTTTSTSCVEGG